MESVLKPEGGHRNAELPVNHFLHFNKFIRKVDHLLHFFPLTDIFSATKMPGFHYFIVSAMQLMRFPYRSHIAIPERYGIDTRCISLPREAYFLEGKIHPSSCIALNQVKWVLLLFFSFVIYGRKSSAIISRGECSAIIMPSSFKRDFS